MVTKEHIHFPLDIWMLGPKFIPDILRGECKNENEIYSVYKQNIFFLGEGRYPCQCPENVSPMDPYKWIPVRCHSTG